MTMHTHEEERNEFKDQANLNEQTSSYDSKPTKFPLDYYLELERNKTKYTLSRGHAKANPNVRAQTLIKHINDLAAEAEQKVKACIQDKALETSPVLSPVSFNESDSGYTEHLVEKKFNEVTYKLKKGAGNRRYLGQEVRRDEKKNTSRAPHYNKLNYSSVQYGTETFINTADSASSSAFPPKQASRKHAALYQLRNNPYNTNKPLQIFKDEKKHFNEHQSKKILSNVTTPRCVCDKRIDNTNDSKLVINTERECADNKLSTCHNQVQIEVPVTKKKYTDASMNTDPLLARLNTRIISVVSTQEEKHAKMNVCANKLCQIQELPNVDIRPNFTKQLGPVIDIKTTKSSTLQKNNVAIVECIYGGSKVEGRGVSAANITNEPSVDIAAPPAVHFRNSRDLKLLKVTKDLLGKLNFKDGSNVEKLKRSLTNLVVLLNQISPIHVANLRLTSLDASTASESIDTFFSNVDLVTEIIENEIKKPTGRYCDYPECLIKAVDLLCGNIKSIFVIEDTKKKTTKPAGSSALDGDKKMVQKQAGNRNRKSSAKKGIANKRPISTSTVSGPDKGGIGQEHSKSYNPPDLYIPYSRLIPGGKHKSMELAENSQDIHLRFKRLEKVLEINKSLKEKVLPREQLVGVDGSQIKNEEDSVHLLNDHHVLNETYIIESDRDDDDGFKKILEKSEVKNNKSEPDYEDDWEMDSSKSFDGSMAMTEIKVAAQVHSSETPAVFAHSSPQKSSSSEMSRELTASNKGSESESLRESKYSSVSSQNKDMKIKERRHFVKSKTGGELKDVETQYNTEKRDTATVTEHLVDLAQTSEAEIIEPIPIAPDIASFTVLRMVDPTKNSLVELRFPEQTDNIQSSLTVQKSKNNEEIKFLYNMNKDENILGWQYMNEKSSNHVSPLIISGKQELVKLDPTKSVGIQPSKPANEKSGVEQKEELNDFESMTSNFIGFLEKKVTEMVSKFKSSEVGCEKFLNQNATSCLDYKTSQMSLNKFPVNPSNSSLKNEFFYKSASSIFSNQSNDEVPGVRNCLSQRCTPENQDILTFENLTSPPVGLQLKQSSILNSKQVTYSESSPNIDYKSNDGTKLFSKCKYLEQNNDNGVSNDMGNNLIINENTEQIKLTLNENNKNTSVFSRFQKRLLPLPEDIIDQPVRKEDSRTSSPIVSVNLSTGQSQRVSNIEEDSLGQVSLPKSKKAESENLGFVSPASTAIVEDTLMTLMSIERTFHNLDKNQEVAVKSVKIPKNEEEADSQRTCASQVGNMLSASDSGMVSITQPNEKASSSNDTYLQKEANAPMLETFSGWDSIKLLPALGPTGDHQPFDRNCFESESQHNFDVDIHSLHIRGPSYMDKGLNSSVAISSCPILKTEKSLIHNTSQTLPTNVLTIETTSGKLLDSSCQTSPLSEAAVQTSYVAPFDSSSQTSFHCDAAIQTSNNIQNNIASPQNELGIQTTFNVSFDNVSQTSSLSDSVTQTRNNVLTDVSLGKPQSDAIIQTNNNELTNIVSLATPQSDAVIQTSSNVPFDNATQKISEINDEAHSPQEVSSLSDDCFQLNYYNPEEMSDGEVGYIFTSNSYSSGEVKLCYDQNDDDSLTGPPTYRELMQELPEQVNRECDKVLTLPLVDSAEENTSAVPMNPHCATQSRQIKHQEHEVFSSSNDSTSTAELKNLFNTEDKIDEGLLGKLLDIHIRCSERFSSESSGNAESAENVEDRS